MRIYKLIGDNNILNVLNTVAKNRGVEDLNKFLNPSKEDVLSPYLLKNMKEAVEMFKKHQKKGKKSKVVVLIDSDPDGYTSSAMIITYIRKHFPDMEVVYIFHKGRQHGLTSAIMKELDKNLPDFLIIPDASSTDLEQHATLKEKGVDILVLDHHDLEEESQDAVVVSNHPIVSPDYSNRELSGAGVVLKFIEALDEEYGINDSENYYTLAATGIVADIMTVTHPETRYYVYEGLKKLKNPMIREYVYKNAYHAIKEAYPSIVSWNVSNYINATIRQGTEEDKQQLFRAMLGEQEQLHRFYKYRGEEREKTEELHQTAYRLSLNARNRQNTLKRKVEAQVKEKIENENLDENSFIIVTLDEFPAGYAGFVAGSLADEYRKPVIITTWNEENQLYSGSGRGYDGVMSNTKEFLDGLNLFEMLAGHEQAFGVSFKKEEIEKINDTINKVVGSTKTPIKVDFEIDSKALNESLIRQFDNHKNLWCKGFDIPLVAIKNVEIDCSSIEFGYPTKFSVKGVSMLSFQEDERLKELSEKGMTAVCDIAGSLEINRYRDKETPQVMIKMIDVKSSKETPAFGGFTF